MSGFHYFILLEIHKQIDYIVGNYENSQGTKEAWGYSSTAVRTLVDTYVFNYNDSECF